MRKIKLITAHHVMEINQLVCGEQNQRSICFDRGKVESALGAAFYPGS